MDRKMNDDEIRGFWTEQAKKFKQSPQASWSDRQAIELEIRTIQPFLRDKTRVIDIGCASGYSTIRYALTKQLSIRGVDYIPEMIEHARVHWASVADQLRSQVDFAVGDICDLNEPLNSYDTVIVTRVLINLGSWEHQRLGLHNAASLLKPGGILLLSEATLQGWRRMNTLRREWQLEEIPMPAFNQYLDEEQIIDEVLAELVLESLENFSSTYYVATRVIKPLLIKALGLTGKVDAADPTMEWNRWSAQLPGWGDYGTQKLFVFRKK